MEKDVDIGEGITFYHLFGHSEAMQGLGKTVEKIAPTDISVLITGPSGTGKNLVAKAIHMMSPRRERAFVKVSCVNIPAELLESELFGYEKGAFTGAYQSKPGRVEFANGGTLFLDEIGDVPLIIQGKLLRLVQDGEFSRLGGYRDMKVDTRIIAATNRNLEEMVREGKFREDLFYRVNVVNIRVPPLKERREEEIPFLIEFFHRKFCEVYNRLFLPISRRCMELMLMYDWPGNIRELENAVRRLVILGEEAVIEGLRGKIEGGLVPEEKGSEDLNLKRAVKEAVERTEKVVIRDALRRTGWKKKEAAELLGISYKALLYKMKQYNLMGGGVDGEGGRADGGDRSP